MPGASWKIKRWPLEHFKKLVQLLPQEKFFILGGPKDNFCQELEVSAPGRIINLAGHLSLKDSCTVLSRSRLVISGDTWAIHLADLTGTPGISLMGQPPLAFAPIPIFTPWKPPPLPALHKVWEGKMLPKRLPKVPGGHFPEAVALKACKLLS